MKARIGGVQANMLTLNCVYSCCLGILLLKQTDNLEPFKTHRCQLQRRMLSLKMSCRPCQGIATIGSMIRPGKEYAKEKTS